MHLFWFGLNFYKYSKSTRPLLKYTVKAKNNSVSLRCGQRWYCHQTLPENNNCTASNNGKFLPFNEMVKFRKDQAERSILVQVQSAKSAKELHSYCSSIGNVKSMFHYTSGIEPLHFILVEFSKKDDVEKVLSDSSYLEMNQVVPVHSPFLWFRAVSKKDKNKQRKVKNLDLENGTAQMKDEDIREELRKCDNISQQMIHLHQLTRLNDLGARLRFLTARQIEISLLGMFPHVKAFPFGSSVNGYGKMGCDLDLILRLCDKEVDETKRLVFHGKASSGTERSASQRTLESIGDLIQLFLPGCAQVRRILQARVPIIKYNQQLTGVECDLSITNMSGYHMSDFLYVMGSVDSRVQPLVYTIRKWASEVGITNSSPGRWISNFSLTLLVLAFLQRPLHSEPVLPSFNTLIKLARPSDKYATEDGINCTFLRDITKLLDKTRNQEPLEILLKEFFEYYTQFDFSAKAISLNEAVIFAKPDHSAMYIVNPLERGLNVSKNVSLEEVEKFKTEVRNAAWVLESEENKKSLNWGLLSVFNSKQRVEPLNFIFSPRNGRLMEVSALFEDENKDQAEPKDDTEFKNEDVARQVQRIKSETRGKIEELKTNAKLQKTSR